MSIRAGRENQHNFKIQITADSRSGNFASAGIKKAEMAFETQGFEPKDGEFEETHHTQEPNSEECILMNSDLQLESENRKPHLTKIQIGAVAANLAPMGARETQKQTVADEVRIRPSSSFAFMATHFRVRKTEQNTRIPLDNFGGEFGRIKLRTQPSNPTQLKGKIDVRLKMATFVNDFSLRWLTQLSSRQRAKDWTIQVEQEIVRKFPRDNQTLQNQLHIFNPMVERLSDELSPLKNKHSLSE
jgi:hypothetical protein